MKTLLGWTLLAISFAPWAVYAVLPFTALSRNAAALVATGAFAAGQVLFIAGLALLGSGALAAIRSRVRCAHAGRQQ